MNLRVWLLTLTLGLAAAGTWWLLRHVTPPLTQTPVIPGHAPDYFFTDATVTTFNKHGKPDVIMTAPRIEHHPDDHSVDVFSPRLDYFVAGSHPWHVRADHGLLPAGGRLIYLDGHVQMTHPGTHDAPPLIIRTDKLTMNLNTNIATSADPVDILQGGSDTTALGLRAYLNTDRLVLGSDVRGIYVPKP